MLYYTQKREGERERKDREGERNRMTDRQTNKTTEESFWPPTAATEKKTCQNKKPTSR